MQNPEKGSTLFYMLFGRVHSGELYLASWCTVI